MEGWREEGDCALPKVKLACVGRGWRDGSSAWHGAIFPPLPPSADKAISPGLLWASAALNLWAFTAYCSVGLTLPTGGGTLCTCRVGKEFKLRVKYVEEFSFWWGNWISMSWQLHCLGKRLDFRWDRLSCSCLYFQHTDMLWFKWITKGYKHDTIIIHSMSYCTCSHCQTESHKK